MRARVRWPLATLTLTTLAAFLWASLAPVHFDSREEVFVIPQGTWARRMAGEKIDILPSEIRLVVGIRDVLVLRNSDDVPQIFGPTLIMPGQSFKLPFDVAADYQFECSAHVSGQMTVVVDDELTSPWARLRYRAGVIFRRASSWIS